VKLKLVIEPPFGPSYLSRQFNDYLRVVGIRHVIALLHHLQTSGKIERYHRTIKGDIFDNLACICSSPNVC